MVEPSKPSAPSRVNPDLAALATMALALVAELIAHVAQDASLLALLPSWLGPVVVALAAGIRWHTTRCPGHPADPEQPQSLQATEDGHGE